MDFQFIRFQISFVHFTPAEAWDLQIDSIL